MTKEGTINNLNRKSKMKKAKSLFGLICLLVLAISSVCLTSCSSDDNDDNTTGNNKAIKVVIDGSTYGLSKGTTGGYSLGAKISGCVAQFQFEVSKDDDASVQQYVILGLKETISKEGQKLEVVSVKNDVPSDMTSGTVTVKKFAGYVLLNFNNVKFSNGITLNGDVAGSF